jgi:hypothetical protein
MSHTRREPPADLRRGMRRRSRLSVGFEPNSGELGAARRQLGAAAGPHREENPGWRDDMHSSGQKFA